jgi:hypothetical protein
VAAFFNDTSETTRGFVQEYGGSPATAPNATPRPTMSQSTMSQPATSQPAEADGDFVIPILSDSMKQDFEMFRENREDNKRQRHIEEREDLQAKIQDLETAMDRAADEIHAAHVEIRTLQENALAAQTEAKAARDEARAAREEASVAKQEARAAEEKARRAEQYNRPVHSFSHQQENIPARDYYPEGRSHSNQTNSAQGGFRSRGFGYRPQPPLSEDEEVAKFFADNKTPPRGNVQYYQSEM